MIHGESPQSRSGAKRVQPHHLRRQPRQRPGIRHLRRRRLLHPTRVVITNDRYRNRAGDWTAGPAAVRQRVTAFHRLAENAAITFRKCAPVLVAGTETVTDYTDRDGNPRTGREIIADHLGVSLAFPTADVHRNAKSDDPTEA